MAERLKVSKGWLSKLLTMATLPDEVVAAFPHAASIPVRGGYELAVKSAGPQRRALLQEAIAVTAEQHEYRRLNLPGLDASTVLRRLLAAGLTRIGDKGEAVLVSAANGRPAMTLQGRRGKILTLRLDLGTGVDRAALIEGLCHALDDVEP